MAIIGSNGHGIRSGTVLNSSRFRNAETLWEVERTLGSLPNSSKSRDYPPIPRQEPAWRVYVLLKAY